MDVLPILKLLVVRLGTLSLISVPLVTLPPTTYKILLVVLKPLLLLDVKYTLPLLILVQFAKIPTSKLGLFVPLTLPLTA